MKNEQFVKQLLQCGMSVGGVNTLFRLVRLARKQNVGFCNGDPHPDNPNPSDKDKSSSFWGWDFNETTNLIQKLIEPHGIVLLFDGVFPSFEIDGRTVFAEVD